MIHRFRLARAYRRLFETEDGRLVLADLMKHSGWSAVTMPNQGRITPETVLHNNGMRATFARIIEFTRMTQDDINALHKDYLASQRRTEEEDEL